MILRFMKNIIQKLNPQTIVIFLVGIIVLAGSATAATKMINGKDIKPNTIGSKQIKNKSIIGKDINPKALAYLRKGTQGPKGDVGPQGPQGLIGPLAKLDQLVKPDLLEQKAPR